MAARFGAAIQSGTTIVAGMPASPAAHATACPWFPLEDATTPGGGGPFSSSVRIWFVAPRALYAPTFCRCSALKTTRRPHASSIARDVSSGVRCTNGRTRSAATRTSLGDGASSGGTSADIAPNAIAEPRPATSRRGAARVELRADQERPADAQVEDGQ